MVLRISAIRIGDVLILFPQEGCRIFFRTATINIESLSIGVCAENIVCFFFFNIAMALIAKHAPTQRITA